MENTISNPGRISGVAAADSIAILVRFCRLVSEAPAPAEIQALLAEVVVDQLGADAAAVLGVGPDGDLELRCGRHLPTGMAGLRVPAGTFGQELGVVLLSRCGGRFAEAHTLALVSSADLYGALVLLYRERGAGQRRRLQGELANGLSDLAAIALAQAAQYEALSRSYDELRASREILSRNEKLRALGQMASGVSHDLRNILSPLVTQVQLLRRMRADEEEDRKELLQRMEQVLWRGVDLVERLRSFSRQAPDTPAARQALNALVSEALHLCRPRCGSQNIRVVEEFGEPPAAQVDGSEFLSAVLNLIVNALDVMPQGGTLTVQSGAREGGGYVTIGDSGPGISKDVLGRLFEPFFTTKGDKGTGLGLSMVYAFAQRHGGRVTVDSQVGEGTRFTLWFPAAPGGLFS